MFLFYIVGGKNLIPNCPVKRQDIMRAEDIFGPKIRSIKGKTTYTTQKHMKSYAQDIPQEIMDKHGEEYWQLI